LAVLPNGDYLVSSETEPSIRIFGATAHPPGREPVADCSREKQPDPATTPRSPAVPDGQISIDPLEVVGQVFRTDSLDVTLDRVRRPGHLTLRQGSRRVVIELEFGHVETPTFLIANSGRWIVEGSVPTGRLILPEQTTRYVVAAEVAGAVTE
jgi:hypothetical protein